jgi:MFS family permease
MALILAYEMVPKHQYPQLAAQIAGATALGSLIGPLIGGAVSEKSTWRWVFLMK